MSDFNENIPTNENEQKNADMPKAPAPAENAEEKSKSNIRFIIEQAEHLIIAFAAIILVFSFLGMTCRVSGESMENTLYNNEMVIVSDFCYTPKRGDIIVFHQTGTALNEPVVKRVIGLPGDTVNIDYYSDTMKVTIIDSNGNTTELDESYIKYDYQRYSGSTSTYVEEGTVFAMGDNRNNSLDSRSSTIGLVDQRRILGKIIFRVTPFSRFGTVD